MFSDEQIEILESAGYLGDNAIFKEVMYGVYEMLDIQQEEAEVLGTMCQKCNRILAVEMVMDLPHETLTERISDAAKMLVWMHTGDC